MNHIFIVFLLKVKELILDNYKFLDWDDIEPVDVIKLKNLNYLHTYSH